MFFLPAVHPKMDAGIDSILELEQDGLILDFLTEVFPRQIQIL